MKNQKAKVDFKLNIDSSFQWLLAIGYWLITISYCLVPNTSQAQVYVRTSTETEHIELKWFSEQLTYPDGVFIYESFDKGKSFKKVYDTPYPRYTNFPSVIGDTSMKFEVATIVADSAYGTLQGIPKLAVIMKMITNNEFAKFTGSYIVNDEIEKGTSVQYKITYIKDDKEIEVGVSPLITAGTPLVEKPVSGIDIKQRKKEIQIKWLPEDKRFYAVNIYRSVLPDSKGEQINDLPILVNEVMNKDGKYVSPDYYYADTIQEGKTYYYSLVGLNFFNKEVTPSKPFKISTKDETAPDAPYWKEHRVTNRIVELNWDYLTKYSGTLDVYKSEKRGSIFNKLNQSDLNNQKTLKDKAVEEGKNYYYYLKASDKSGNASFSDTISVSVEDKTPPAIPTGLKVKADTGRMVLSWNANSEPDIDGYWIYRNAFEDGAIHRQLISPEVIKENNYIDILPKNARNKFTYEIIAMDKVGNRSKFSSSAGDVLPDVTPPATPFIKESIVHSNSVLIEWLPVFDADLKQFDVFRSIKGANSWTKLATLEKIVTKYNDKSIQKGVEYEYKVQSMDLIGNKSPYSNIYEVQIPNIILANAVSNVMVAYDTAQKIAKISWIGTEEVITGYVVYRMKEGGKMFPVSTLTSSNSYADSTIRSKNSYYYQVRTISKTGEVAKSEKVKLIIN